MNGATNLIDKKLSKNYSQGNGSSLTKNVEFTCPSDGYVKAIFSNSSSVKTVNVQVKDTAGTWTGLFRMAMPASANYQTMTTFVKKGMALRWDNSSTNESVIFYPIV